MTAVPHKKLDPFFTGFPIVIKTTPTFEAGASISDLTGATLTARIKSAAGVVIVGTTSLLAGEVTMTFPSATLTAGVWEGQLSYQSDMMATFVFKVEQTI